MFGFKKAPAWSPFKSGKDHEKFVAMVFRISNAAGFPLRESDEEGVLVSASDREVKFGLMNLAQQCTFMKPNEWEGVIAQHVRSLAAARRDTSEQMPWEEARKEVKLRLFPPDIPGEGLITYPVASEFYTVLVLDKPDVVATVTQDQRTSWEVSDEELYTTALENVWAEGRLAMQPHHSGNALLRIAHGDSFFVASHALLLDRYVLDESPLGLLVSVPVRNMLIYHEIVEGAFDAAFTGMLQSGAHTFQQGPGSISPHLFWVKEGRWEPLTTIEVGTLKFSASEKFHNDVLSKVSTIGG